eukprot:1812064-Rhodomonas_salina.1
MARQRADAQLNRSVQDEGSVGFEEHRVEVVQRRQVDQVQRGPGPGAGECVEVEIVVVLCTPHPIPISSRPSR